MGATGMLCNFKLVVDGKEVHESSRLEFLGKISANIAGDNTSEPLNRGRIVDKFCLEHF